MKILFLIAHPDDEAYGPYGTILKKVQEGHDVYVYSLCNGERPGSFEVGKSRVDSFIENCKDAGVTWRIWDNSDLTLDIKTVSELVTKLINDHQFNSVYTHNISDLNRDHRILADAALVGCRPKPNSTVEELYFFEVPSSTDWAFYQLQPIFQPNVYIEISDELMLKKKLALSKYDTETYNFPDARSVEAMVTLAKYRGYQSGVNFAEAFQLIFSRSRN